MAQSAQQVVAPITDQVQQTAGQAVDQAKQQAMTQVSTQKDHAATSLDAVAKALRQSGTQLKDSQQEPLANLANTAAHHVEQFSGYLRNTDVNEMIHDIEDFARRQPAAFLGGAFTLGVLAARFLKSSRPINYGASANNGTPQTPLRQPTYGGVQSRYSTLGPAGASRYPAPRPVTPPATSLSRPATSDTPIAGMGQDTRESPYRPTGTTGPMTADREPTTSTTSAGNPAGATPSTSGWGQTTRRMPSETEPR